MSLRQQGIWISPFPVSPFGGKAGAGGFPPRRKHDARQQKTLARVDATGSPHKRAAAPLCIPRLAGGPGQWSATKTRFGESPERPHVQSKGESFTQNT